MNRHRLRVFLTLLVVATLSGDSASLIAQEANEVETEFDFDAPETESAEDSRGPAAPTTVPPAAPSAAPAGDAEAPAVAESAVVRTIRESNPQTPVELMRAIDQLIRLDRPDAAKEFLQRLSTQNLDDTSLARLHQQFGTAVFLRLTRSQELAPQSAEFAIRVMKAARQMAADPDQLARWVNELSSADRRLQQRAVNGLLRAGASAVPALVDALSGERSARERALVFQLFQQMKMEAYDPLLAYRYGSLPQARSIAIAALGQTGSSDALPYLVAPLFAYRASDSERNTAVAAWQQIRGQLPDRSEAIQLLELSADRAYRGLIHLTPDTEDQVQRWTWSEQQKRSVSQRMASRDAAMLTASRLYSDLTQVEPQRIDYAQRYLISRLELDQSLGGLDQLLRRDAGSAFQVAGPMTPQQLNEVLARALADGHEAAAIGAAELLAARGDSSVLMSVGDPRTPLVQAVMHPNRRLRFRAAQALYQLRPANSFSGASRLMDALVYFAASQGRSGALIAHPRIDIGAHLAGLLSSIGYSTLTATTEQDLMEQSVASPDIELIFISDAMNSETTWSIVESLRVHPKTARLPIAILARSERWDEMEMLAESDPRVLVLPETIDAVGLTTELPRLRALAGRAAVPPAQRLEQAALASEMLQHLREGK
jgi:hypothetical protein